MNYDDVNKAIIRMMQDDLPLVSRPYQDLAKQLGITEEEIIVRLQEMNKQGIIKRIGAILHHQEAGYNTNAMVIWKVDESCIDLVGQTLAGFKEISHCYHREVPPDLGYNLFSMIHARNSSQLQEVIDKIVSVTGITDYLVIKSLKELKKTSMKYID